MASATLRKTGYTGAGIYRHSIRVDFMYKRVRYRHASGIESTKASIKHAVANQLGHNDRSMLVKVYGRRIDSESPRELERIWEGMQSMVQNASTLPQKLAA